MEYTFTLKYRLTDDDRGVEALIERLGELGCDDALVGIGQPGRLALEFTREADSAEAAVCSALFDVRRAIPAAKLIEATPDLVGLTDVAEIVGVSRQNMRKLMLTHPDSFPMPVHEGSTSIWHLTDILMAAGQRKLCPNAGCRRGGSGHHAGQRREGTAPSVASVFGGAGGVGRVIGSLLPAPSCRLLRRHPW